MQILGNTSNNYQPTSAFTSRKAEIKVLDKVCRDVCREFPVHSPTRMNNYTASTKHPNAYNILGFLDDMVTDLRGFVRFTVDDKKKLLMTELKNTKKYKIGNCNELADAGYIACQINGYKNAVPVNVYAFNTKTKNFRKIDHTAVGINFKKELKDKPSGFNAIIFCDDREAIIMDPWCGFTDYANNASVKYKSHIEFGKNLKPEEKICYIPLKQEDLREKDILFYKHEYPSLTGKKKFGLIDRIKWFFTNKSQFETEEFPRTVLECHKTNHRIKGALTPTEIGAMYYAEQKNKLEEFFEEVRKK